MHSFYAQCLLTPSPTGGILVGGLVVTHTKHRKNGGQAYNRQIVIDREKSKREGEERKERPRNYYCVDVRVRMRRGAVVD